MEPALAVGLAISAVILIVLPLLQAGVMTFIGVAFAGPEGWFPAFVLVWGQALWRIALGLLGIWALVGLFLLIVNAVS